MGADGSHAVVLSIYVRYQHRIATNLDGQHGVRRDFGCLNCLEEVCHADCGTSVELKSFRTRWRWSLDTLSGFAGSSPIEPQVIEGPQEAFRIIFHETQREVAIGAKNSADSCGPVVMVKALLPIAKKEDTTDVASILRIVNLFAFVHVKPEGLPLRSVVNPPSLNCMRRVVNSEILPPFLIIPSGHRLIVPPLCPVDTLWHCRLLSHPHEACQVLGCSPCTIPP